MLYPPCLAQSKMQQMLIQSKPSYPDLFLTPFVLIGIRAKLTHHLLNFIITIQVNTNTYRPGTVRCCFTSYYLFSIHYGLGTVISTLHTISLYHHKYVIKQLFLSLFYFIFSFWPCPWHAEVLWPGIKPLPQQ